ncbi:hypothetical protein DDZ13_10315 [Coraliomargarita sinensis]|uniref:Alpha-1,2-fucosyltransferase n=1 Tax=Coraliomargarita sinensis TaxID=2174842 RepID=A0A317ZEL1_9BACT|nr:hypothetical protein DDZ13_10315 [Coraliomargarita sinensis]
MLSKNKEIYAYLKGGLGNQLFIYATNRALALRTGSSLIFDVATAFKADRRYQRRFHLNDFKLSSDITFRKKRDPLYRMRRRCWNRGGPWVRQRMRRFYLRDEYHGGNDPRDVEVRGQLRTDGYWTNEAYFAAFHERIASELTFYGEIEGDDLTIAEVIAQPATIGIHVRRVDYGSTLSVSYYRSALELMRRRVPVDQVVCFSDDPAWCHQNLRLDAKTYFVEGDRRSAIDDLRLLSRCQNLIIANSTFSWWGAWLGKQSGSIVIRPARSGFNQLVYPDRWLAVEDR